MRDVTEIALFTDDVAAAAAFYRSLVGAAPVAQWPGGALFAAGDAKILVHARAAAMEGGPPNEDHFALSVDNLDTLPGKAALVFVLLGADGAYGEKDSAQALLPTAGATP